MRKKGIIENRKIIQDRLKLTEKKDDQIKKRKVQRILDIDGKIKRKREELDRQIYIQKDEMINVYKFCVDGYKSKPGTITFLSKSTGQLKKNKTLILLSIKLQIKI